MRRLGPPTSAGVSGCEAGRECTRGARPFSPRLKEFELRCAALGRTPRPAADAPPVELAIASVGHQGDGAPADGAPHVAFTLPGERVLARVAGDRGELAEVLEPSAERVVPPCPHFGVCGGCALQHWDHAPYLRWKVEQVRLALARERIETAFAPAFAARPGTRRRLALHARRGGREAAVLGFKARRSWSLVPISVCPISDPRLVETLPELRRLAAPLFEHPKSAPTLHVTLTETGLDVDITGRKRASRSSRWAASPPPA